MPYRHDDLQSIPRNHMTIWVQSHGLALQALGTGDRWTSMAYFSVKLPYLAYLKTLFQSKGWRILGKNTHSHPMASIQLCNHVQIYLHSTYTQLHTQNKLLFILQILQNH